jgi:hypothetical protein
LYRNKFFFSVLFLLLASLVPVHSEPSLPVVPQGQFSSLLKQAPTLNPQALQMALNALGRLKAAGQSVRSDVLMVIDYSKRSTEPRLWVLDLNRTGVLFQELVAHGRNSGDDRAVRFSNEPGSLMSSLGLFLTADTYMGKHGLSLRLQGLQKGLNDNSLERAIVIHAADYVSEGIAQKAGRIGRSWGCPAVRPAISRKLIETVQGGVLMLAYYPGKV